MQRFLIALSLLAAPLVAFAPSAQAAKHHKKHEPKISMDDAKKIALAKVSGTIKAAELEHEKGRWIYSFEIRPDGEKRKIVKEVNIDSDTGAIVEVDTERE